MSSDPLYVCVCDNGGKPECTNSSFIVMNKNVYPGERFTLLVAIVGVEYGITVGTVYADFFTI